MTSTQFVSMSLIMASIWQAASCRAEDAAIESFRAKYAAEGRSSEQSFDNWRGTVEYQESPRDPSSTKLKKTSTMEFAVSGQLKKLVTHYPAEPRAKSVARDEVFILDEKQAYTLGKKRDSTDYVLNSIISTDKGVEWFDGGFGRFLAAPCSLLSRRISKILAKSSTRLDSVKVVDYKGQSMVQAEFHYGSAGQSLATVLFDPALGYRVRRSELQIGDLNNVKTISTVDYRVDKSGRVVPTIIECQDLDGNDKKLTFRSVSFGEVPPQEFSPMFFGLPDVSTPNRANTRGYMAWLTGGAVACFCAGVGLWLIARRFR